MLLYAECAPVGASSRAQQVVTEVWNSFLKHLGVRGSRGKGDMLGGGPSQGRVQGKEGLGAQGRHTQVGSGQLAQQGRARLGWPRRHHPVLWNRECVRRARRRI